MPARTIDPPTPTPTSPTPKSSAANSTVWVNSVLTKAEAIDAAARRPSTLIARGSRRSGGAHHGVGGTSPWWSVWVRAAPRRPSAARTGMANSQPNHGIASR